MDKYAISAIGITISLAGNPRINARSITPSIPTNLPTGSSTSAILQSKVVSATWMFASTHMIKPAGAATTTALSKTNIIFSRMVSPIKVNILGFLYGGISRTNELETPFKTVDVSTFDEANVTSIETAIIPKSIIAESTLFLQKNIDIIAIIKGNTPPILW